MRLKKQQILYVRSMGKALKVTAIFTGVDECNQYCEKNRDEGLVAEFGKYLFVANLYDQGTKIKEE